MATKKTSKGSKITQPKPTATIKERDVRTLSQIQKLAEGAVRAANQKKNPALEIPVRALSNVSFNEKKRIIELGDKMQSREFFNISMARKYMQTFLVANGCKTLIESGKTISI